MTKLVELDDARALDVAAAALEAGDAIVLPTDTVYGVAASPAHHSLLYDLKGRPESIPIAMLVATTEQARLLAEFDERADRLAAALWPGPLTIVLRARGDGGTVGVRCPNHGFVRALTGRVGPLAVTSANRHGEPTPTRAVEAAGALTGPVAVVIDGGECAGEASTVVDLTAAELMVVRVGPIAEQEIRATALR